MGMPLTPPGHAENVRERIVAIIGFYACFA